MNGWNNGKASGATIHEPAVSTMTSAEMLKGMKHSQNKLNLYILLGV
jgi:hypothetical protein